MALPIDFIEMIIPARQEFVSVVRLTVSGIANHMGYSVEEIDDIKIAVSEAFSNVVECFRGNKEDTLQMKFVMHEDKLVINILDRMNVPDLCGIGVIRESFMKESSDDSLGLYLIDALMDNVEINTGAGVCYTMEKYLHKRGVEQNGKIKELL